MELLKIIKQRKSIRKYQDKPIPKRIIEKIIEAGVWGPSVPSFLRIQPWRFIVVCDKKTIQVLADIVLEKSRQSTTGVNILLHTASDIIRNAAAVSIVYNSKDLDKMKSKFKVIYSKFEKMIKTAQLCAISAAIQNMLLAAEALGVGSCWLDTPLFCEKEINKYLKSSEDLVGVLTFGYPAETGKRAQRKPFEEAVRYIV